MKGREEVTMKKTMVKRLMSWVLAAAMVVAMLPVSVLGAPVEGSVAKIGDTEYATLDAAVEEAKEGATIELLTDCELTKGFNKTLTFTGNGKISINKQLTSNGEGWMCFGLGDPTRVLTFDGAGVEVEWNSEVGTSPWLMLSLSGTMNVINGAKVTFTVDSGATGSRNAIYMNAGSEINVTNGSSFTINGNETDGKEGQGIQLDTAAQSTINVTGNSSFIIDGTNRGYVNSPTIYVEDSTFTVRNCTANASNGGNFTAVNSQVLYQDNAGHGLSASNIVIQNSSLVADNNGYYGIYDSGKFEVDSTSEVVVTRNSADGDFAGLKLTSGVTDGKVEDGAVITITNNYCSGLSNNGECVFEEGAKLTIMNNNNDKGGSDSSHGGGIYNSGASAKLTLPSDAVIYNNHSKTDGDDIFNNTTATITFGKVGTDWVLDDCKHLIDGWYLDGEDEEGTRWQVCKLEEGEEPYAVKYALEKETVTVTGLKALKAAHGLEPKDKVSYPGLDKKVGDDDEKMNDDDVDAAAGQKVNFQLTSNVPTDLLNYLNPEDVTPPSIDGEEPGTAQEVNLENRGAYVLTFHDVLDPMLTNLENYVVKIGEITLTADRYTLTTTDLEDGCSFEISLDLAALYEAGVIKDADIKNSTLITVTYDATLSADATAGTYENTAWVTAPKDWTTSKDIVYVNTYAIDIFKYDQADKTGLVGAEFTLTDAEGTVIDTVTSGEDGHVVIDGLDAGTYTLTETKAPDGYVKSDTPLTIVIPKDADGENVVSVSFANSQIPHTGGTGTLMFTIGGAAIIATAGVLLLVSRKKRKA